MFTSLKVCNLKIFYETQDYQMARWVKNLPSIFRRRCRKCRLILGLEDPWKKTCAAFLKGISYHWRIHGQEELLGVESYRLQRVRHNQSDWWCMHVLEAHCIQNTLRLHLYRIEHCLRVSEDKQALLVRAALRTGICWSNGDSVSWKLIIKRSGQIYGKYCLLLQRYFKESKRISFSGKLIMCTPHGNGISSVCRKYQGSNFITKRGNHLLQLAVLPLLVSPMTWFFCFISVRIFVFSNWKEKWIYQLNAYKEFYSWEYSHQI